VQLGREREAVLAMNLGFSITFSAAARSFTQSEESQGTASPTVAAKSSTLFICSKEKHPADPPVRKMPGNNALRTRVPQML